MLRRPAAALFVFRPFAAVALASALAAAASACGSEGPRLVAADPEFDEDPSESDPGAVAARDASVFDSGAARDDAATGGDGGPAGDGGPGAGDAAVDAGPPPILGTYTARVNGTSVRVKSAIAKYTAIADLVDVTAIVVLPSGADGRILLRAQRVRTGCDGSSYVSTSGPSFGFINTGSDCGLAITRFSKVVGQRIAATYDGTVATAQDVTPRSARLVFAFDLEISP